MQPSSQLQPACPFFPLLHVEVVQGRVASVVDGGRVGVVSKMILGQQRKLGFFVRIGEEIFEEIRQCQKHEKNTFCFMDEDLFKRIQRFYGTPPCKQKYQPTDKSYDF